MIKISTRSRFGLRLLVDLAQNTESRLESLETVSKRQRVSRLYLTQIVQDLRKAGFVQSVKGRKGGVSLTRSPEQIQLADVMLVLEGETFPLECLNNPDSCEKTPTCGTRPFWAEIKSAIEKVLNSRTLADLVQNKQMLA